MTEHVESVVSAGDAADDVTPASLQQLSREELVSLLLEFKSLSASRGVRITSLVSTPPGRASDLEVLSRRLADAEKVARRVVRAEAIANRRVVKLALKLAAPFEKVYRRVRPVLRRIRRGNLTRTS